MTVTVRSDTRQAEDEALLFGPEPSSLRTLTNRAGTALTAPPRQQEDWS